MRENKIRRPTIAAFAAVASKSTTACAADLHGGGSLKDAPAAIWAGLYVDGRAGFGVGNQHVQTPEGRQRDEGDYEPAEVHCFEGESGFDVTSQFRSDHDVDGAIHGVHVGYIASATISCSAAPNSA